MSDAKALHARDLAAGHGRVWRPYAYAAKWPGAGREFAWQYLFPSSKLSADPRDDSPASGDPVTRRHHLHENTIQKGVKKAVLSCGHTKRVRSRPGGFVSPHDGPAESGRRRGRAVESRHRQAARRLPRGADLRELARRVEDAGPNFG